MPVRVQLDEVASLLVRASAELASRDEEEARRLDAEARRMRGLARERLQKVSLAVCAQLDPRPPEGARAEFDIQPDAISVTWDEVPKESQP